MGGLDEWRAGTKQRDTVRSVQGVAGAGKSKPRVNGSRRPIVGHRLVQPERRENHLLSGVGDPQQVPVARSTPARAGLAYPSDLGLQRGGAGEQAECNEVAYVAEVA